MIIDFSIVSVPQSPLSINGEAVEIVPKYKCLGTIIDNHLSFNKKFEAVYKKVNSRMYFVKKLNKFSTKKNGPVLFRSN